MNARKKSFKEMQRYVEQLIEDLELIAQNPPTPHYVEYPEYMENGLELSEIVNVPYKPLAEWTGFSIDNFPDVTDLSMEQIEAINKTIIKVLDSLHIDLADMPENISPEWFYVVLTSNWEVFVQYLPSSGFDLELCTGDPDTCEWGMECDCANEDFDEFDEDVPYENIEDFDENELPF